MTDEEKPSVRGSDPETSEEGYVRADKSKLDAMILSTLQDDFGKQGATSNEIAECRNYQHNCISPRLSRLEERGLVKRNLIGFTENGRRKYEKRTGPWGRGRIVWWHWECFDPKEPTFQLQAALPLQ